MSVSVCRCLHTLILHVLSVTVTSEDLSLQSVLETTHIQVSVVLIFFLFSCYFIIRSDVCLLPVPMCVQVCLRVSVCVTRALLVDSAIIVHLDTEIFLSVFAVSVTCQAAPTLTPVLPAPAR